MLWNKAKRKEEKSYRTGLLRGIVIPLGQRGTCKAPAARISVSITLDPTPMDLKEPKAGSFQGALETQYEGKVDTQSGCPGAERNPRDPYLTHAGLEVQIK